MDGEFLEAIYRSLIDGGELWIKTDHEAYFQQISKAAVASDLWNPLDWEDEGYPRTDFEEQFLAREFPFTGSDCASETRIRDNHE